MKKDIVHFIRWETIPEKDVERTLSALSEIGVKNIVAHPKWFRATGESYIEQIQCLLKKYDLRSTASHALWGQNNDCINPDPVMQADMICRQSHFLRQLQTLQVTTFTIHLGYCREMSIEQNFALLAKSIDSLLPVCEETGITLALENIGEPAGVIHRMSEMVQQYHHPMLGTCYDCGHANCYSGGIEETLKIMKDNIVTCHLHDNYGQHDDHNPPGEGNIDWQKLNLLLDSLPRLQHVETEAENWGNEA